MTNPISLEYDRRPSAFAYMVRGALPSNRRRDALAPAIGARWTGHRVDADALADFERATGLPERETLPILYPHVFGFRLAMAILTHPTFPVPIWGVLQTRNHFLERAPLARDAIIDLETRVATARVLEKGVEFDLHTTARAEREVAWESIVTFYARGRFGAAGAESELARAPSVPTGSTVEWTMPDDGHWRFGDFTGDYNGIHMWRGYARRFGFAEALYHPPRVLAHCLAHLSNVEPRAPRRLDVWLKGPVPHGATVRLRSAPCDRGALFALHVEEARPCIVGRLVSVDGDSETLVARTT